MKLKLNNLKIITFSMLFYVLTGTVQASIDTVTTHNGSGTGSLTEKISMAQPGDTIVFAYSLIGDTIKLNSEITIVKKVSIVGLGRDSIFIDGSQTNRIFSIPDSGRIMTLINLTLTNGFSSDSGGAIYNKGILTLTNCAIRNSRARDGGGILNIGTLTMTNTILSQNSANTGNGGGIFNLGGSVNTTNCTISNNSAFMGGGGIAMVDSNSTILNTTTISNNSANTGGGLFVASGVTLNNCVINGNTATNNGGGIETSGSTKINNCTITGNRVLNSAGNGGGISSSNTLNITICSIDDNTSAGGGGGVYISSGTATSVKSSISLNSAGLAGGGFLNHGRLTITNNTISTNSGSDGGGIWNNGFIQINNATIAFNQASLKGGGIWNQDTIKFKHIIVAKDTALSGGFEIYNAPGGVAISQGYNLVMRDIPGTGFFPMPTDLLGTTVNPVDPQLGPLQNNGGTTLTHDLSCQSPAIDAGDPSATTPAEDQRGKPRKRTMDIGAVESQYDAIIITPVITFESEGGTMDGQIELTISGGQSPYYYHWNTNDSTKDLTGISAGNYSVTVTDFYGCRQTAVISLFVVSEKEPDPSAEFAIYPNPTDGTVYINNQENFNQNFFVSIKDLSGKTLYAELKTAVNKTVKLNIQDLPKGVYIITATSGHRQYTHKRLLKF